MKLLLSLFVAVILFVGCKKEDLDKKPKAILSSVRIVRGDWGDSLTFAYENDKVIQIKRYHMTMGGYSEPPTIFNFKYEGNTFVCNCQDLVRYPDGFSITNDSKGNLKMFKTRYQEYRYRYNLKGQLTGIFSVPFDDYLYDENENITEVRSTFMPLKITYSDYENPFRSINLPAKIFLSHIADIPLGQYFNSLSKNAVSRLESSMTPETTYKVIPEINQKGLIEAMEVQTKFHENTHPFKYMKFYYQ
jgi:hypothetical protein